MFAVAFDEIARKNCPELYRRALKLTRNSSHAWDLVQDTFERALRRFPSDLPPPKVRSWLLVIMRNLFLDRMRMAASRGRRLRPGQDWASLIWPGPEEEEKDTTLISERFRAEDVHACLAELPAVLRQPYEMHEFGGLSYRDIALLLGLRHATVGTRIFRARRRLCALLLSRAPPSDPLDLPLTTRRWSRPERRAGQ